MHSTLALHGGPKVRDQSRHWPTWPEHGETEQVRVAAVLASGTWADVDGPEVRALSERFAIAHGTRYGLAVSSGTAALWITLRALGVGVGDEVILPAYTFMATASVVLEVGATPVFVDIEPLSLNMDPGEVAGAISERTRAIISVHMAGIPCNMKEIVRIGQSHGIPIVEDAAQAHGASIDGVSVGGWGDMGCFSFQASKNLSSGEGGMIVLNDSDGYALVWSLHNCGRKMGEPWYKHFLLGENWRMTEMQAAILQAQMDRWPDHRTRRQRNAAYLTEHLLNVDEVALPTIPSYVTEAAWHLFPFWVRDANSVEAVNLIASALQAEGLPVFPGYPMPLYRQPLFQHYQTVVHASHGEPYLFHTEKACDQILWIPQYALLGGEDDMKDLIVGIKKVLSHTQIRSRLTSD